MTDVRVESDGRCSLVCRFVDGVCVWGQAFSTGGEPELHVAQVAAVVDAIYADPDLFDRRHLWAKPVVREAVS